MTEDNCSRVIFHLDLFDTSIAIYDTAAQPTAQVYITVHTCRFIFSDVQSLCQGAKHNSAAAGDELLSLSIIASKSSGSVVNGLWRGEKKRVGGHLDRRIGQGQTLQESNFNARNADKADISAEVVNISKCGQPTHQHQWERILTASPTCHCLRRLHAFPLAVMCFQWHHKTVAWKEGGGTACSPWCLKLWGRISEKRMAHHFLCSNEFCGLRSMCKAYCLSLYVLRNVRNKLSFEGNNSFDVLSKGKGVERHSVGRGFTFFLTTLRFSLWLIYDFPDIAHKTQFQTNGWKKKFSQEKSFKN